MKEVYKGGALVLKECYQPMYYFQSYRKALREWRNAKKKWPTTQKTLEPEYADMTFEEYEGEAPNPDYYRPWEDGDPSLTWWQVWETVSEGTPVTPPFATKEELVEYLVENGDFWDQERRRDREIRPWGLHMPCEPWTRAQAEAFVYGDGWAPSGVGTAQGGFKTGIQFLGEQHEQKTKEGETDS